VTTTHRLGRIIVSHISLRLEGRFVCLVVSCGLISFLQGVLLTYFCHVFVVDNSSTCPTVMPFSSWTMT